MFPRREYTPLWASAIDGFARALPYIATWTYTMAPDETDWFGVVTLALPEVEAPETVPMLGAIDMNSSTRVAKR